MKPLEVPTAPGDLIGDPARVIAAFERLNALTSIEVHLVPVGGSPPLAPGNQAIRGNPPNFILPLPLKLDKAIADSTATAASVSAQLNLLLAALRKTGQLPT